jgi:hypothetical protein
LGGRVDNERGTKLLQQCVHSRPVSDVEFVVPESGQLPLEAALVPTGISCRAKEHCALVVVHAVHLETKAPEVKAHFGPNQPIRAGDKYGLLGHDCEEL